MNKITPRTQYNLLFIFLLIEVNQTANYRDVVSANTSPTIKIPVYTVRDNFVTFFIY